MYFNYILYIAELSPPFFFISSTEGKEKLSVASQKNRLLAIVLIMTGCPQATIRDGEGRSVFVEALKKSLASDNVEVKYLAKNNNNMCTVLLLYIL